MPFSIFIALIQSFDSPFRQFFSSTLWQSNYKCFSPLFILRWEFRRCVLFCMFRLLIQWPQMLYHAMSRRSIKWFHPAINFFHIKSPLSLARLYLRESFQKGMIFHYNKRSDYFLGLNRYSKLFWVVYIYTGSLNNHVGS